MKLFSPVREVLKLLLAFTKSMLFAGGYTMLVRRFVCLITKNYKFFGCNYSLTKLPTFGQPSWEESRSTLNPLPDNQKSHYTVSTNQWRFAICWQRGETGRLQFPTVSVFLCLSAQASSVTTTWTIESRFENPTWRSWTSCWLIAEHAIRQWLYHLNLAVMHFKQSFLEAPSRKANASHQQHSSLEESPIPTHFREDSDNSP